MSQTCCNPARPVRDVWHARTAAVGVLLVSSMLFAAAPAGVLARQGVAGDETSLGDRGLVAREQALLDLTNPFTVMCVACHPDDEDGLTLTLERRKFGARTVTLFATSGEGGQNAVGPELYDELGRIRERETVEAAAVQGSRPYFLRLPDFGYSKSGDEAMAVWEKAAGGHDALLRLFVAAIRDLRPDVVITNHDTKTGHGQHQATGRLLVEALAAAPDPARFPDAGKPWQPQSVLVRASRESAGSIVIGGAGYDAVRGLSYREIAFRALLRHATQGPWRFEMMPTETRYQPLTRPKPTSERIGSPLTQGLDVPRGAFVVGRSVLDASGADLRSLLVQALTTDVVSDEHRPRLIAGILAVDGIDVRLGFTSVSVVAGTNATARLQVSNAGSAPISVTEVFLSSTNVAAVERQKIGPDGTAAASSRKSIDFDLPTDALLDADTRLSRPRPCAYDPFSATPRGSSDDAFERVSGTVTVQTGGLALPVGVVAFLQVTPPVGARATPKEDANGQWSISVANLSPRPLDVSLAADGAERRTLAPGAGTVFVIAHPPTNAVTVYGRVSAPAGPLRSLATVEARDLTVPVDVASGLRVGFVRSFDYTLPRTLDRLGVRSRELSVDDLRVADLSRYDTIVLDNRAYVKYPDLASVNDRLLTFVREGGTLVVFYHKRGEYPDGLAPYPFTIGNGRVTDENAPVTLLEPSNDVFSRPNRITARDFDGWIQERGVYFPSEWAPQYVTPMETHDPGEQDLRGGMLVAPYGKGRYVYTSIVWYRQLRGFVPGGFRIFANLISLGKS